MRFSKLCIQKKASHADDGVERGTDLRLLGYIRDKRDLKGENAPHETCWPKIDFWIWQQPLLIP